MSLLNQPLTEAEAFDARVSERVLNGMIPDLQRTQPCDWFYNNPWRRPEYVNMIFGEYFRFALAHLPPAPAHILEVGSGLGHMTLELGRQGYRADGVELSAKSVEIAQQMLAENPCTQGFGQVRYFQSDFFEWQPDRVYDAVCFFLSLHHFPNPQAIVEKVCSLLKPEGIVIVVEPARDWFSTTNAVMVALIRLLLSSGRQWHEILELPTSELELGDFVRARSEEYREARDSHEPAQSPEDNSSYADAILSALQSRLDDIVLCPSYAFLPRMVGGIRAETEEQTQQLAAFLHLFDRFCVQRGILQPGAFQYAGRLKSL